MIADLTPFVVSATEPIREVMLLIDRNARGIALAVDDEQRLIGTVTDGDIRRAVLSGTDLSVPVQALLDQKLAAGLPRPRTARVGTSDAELLRMMSEQTLRHIPLVDERGHVRGLALLGDLVKEYELPLRAVVMAGGYGTRLRPLTEDLPKPMLPVGDRPLMQVIIDQLRSAGIRRVNVTTHYQPDKISSYFGDGSEFGVELSYVREDLPLGTAGALSLLSASEDPLLVVNGDVLARVDFRAMLEHHREHKAEMTVAVRQYAVGVPYGVVESNGPLVRDIREKPNLTFLVNAGIYLLEPSVVGHIPIGERFDMTDLIRRLLEERRSVVSFPIVGYWLDIGSHGDYVQAQADVREGRFPA